MRLHLVSRVAVEEWRALRRSRVALIAGFLLAALTGVSTLLGLGQRDALNAARARYQSMSDERFDAQPDRNPHRMVHYGQFVFRPLSPLAFFDPGVDSFTGSTVFLEGHRQNSANFSEARQSSLLLRFGQLTPAFLLQTVAPLLIIFLAFGAVARERERGTLRWLLAQGLRPGELLAGKLMGHGGVALLVGAPATLVLVFAVITGAAPTGEGLLLVLAYALYLLLWALGAVLVSALTRRGRDALTLLVSAWMVLVILLPRILPEFVAAHLVLPTRVETDIAINRELKSIGDSHNPEDPYFARFKAETLARYGVSDVKDLPLQWKALVGMEGERLTSDLFVRHAREAFAREAQQNDRVRLFGMLSPVIALRQVSMALAGTDLEHHQQFLGQVEGFRYAFVQALNQLDAEMKPSAESSKDNRLSATHWKELPDFTYRAPVLTDEGRRRLAFNLFLLGGWVVLLGGLYVLAARRLGKVVP